VIVREVLAGEMDAVGALRVEAYQADNLLAGAPSYIEELRSLGAGGHGTVLVAAEDTELLGTVMLETWHPGSEIARGAGEVEVRAFAVAPGAQRRGIGRALMRAVIDMARADGAERIVLCTQQTMTAAQRLYQAEGFTRIPGRDWTPVPGMRLLAYSLALSPLARR
jgi:ribosomal protein S18 acetylase RimI-like enzyme